MLAIGVKKMEISTDLISVNEFSEKYPTFTKGALRSYIFNAKQNGFSEVIRRIGSRVFIKEKNFFEWVERINGIQDLKEGA